jgi:carbohydrate-selective porin OprB
MGHAERRPRHRRGGVFAASDLETSVPQQPSQSQGISFSATQDIDARYGVFLRANNASGHAMPIETSVAFGAIVNDPFHRNHLDQAGIGLAWNKTNLSAVQEPVRRSEQLAELYYNFAVFKAMSVTPDVQVYVNPALAPQTSVAAVFTLRTTFNF